MQNLVKTTVTIPEDLLIAAKIKAIKEKTTLGKLIQEGLKIKLKRELAHKTGKT